MHELHVVIELSGMALAFDRLSAALILCTAIIWIAVVWRKV